MPTSPTQQSTNTRLADKANPERLSEDKSVQLYCKYDGAQAGLSNSKGTTRLESQVQRWGVGKAPI